MNRRVILIVLDSFGVGALPDAASYGDAGADTLGHIRDTVPGFDLPNLCQLGLGRLVNPPWFADRPVIGAYGKAMERSVGKDTTVGHWEIAGLIQKEPFPTYPDGFPDRVIQPFEQAIGRSVLGNRPASGTQIIQELGDEHVKTGFPIVYTSADSVFQIAAHESVIPPEQLYEFCKTARKLLVPPDHVARVIARPFTGSGGAYVRTARRHDFSLAPTGETVLDCLTAGGVPTYAVGKINDIFAGRGISHAVATVSNLDGVQKTLDWMKSVERGLIFTNLVDFDMIYGHRRDAAGYAAALAEFDRMLPEIQNAMHPEDLLILTADHGCDPTYRGTDHTREYTPVLLYRRGASEGMSLGIRNTFADVAATVAAFLGCTWKGPGENMLFGNSQYVRC